MADVFIHSHALCESQHIGAGTRVWAFAHVLPGAHIGVDCNICDHVFVENDVVVGDRVTVKCGVQLWDGIRLEDDVFVGPNATFANDRFPRSKQFPPEFAKTFVRSGASIGANATVLPGLNIGQRAMVGAGAVVTQSVPPNAVVVGNPAKIIGYADTKAYRPAEPETDDFGLDAVKLTTVRQVTLHQLREIKDMRGNLTAAEFGTNVPFSVHRYFLVYDVPSLETRGEHAHRQCKQFLVAVRGKLHVIADDGRNREEFVLDRPNLGLYLPPMVWGIQWAYSPDAVLMVLASHHYDAADYVRDYGEFLDLTRTA